jgi:aerobic-type carbon monoxide dehydrogenase small subunit (CoxS/CutS family)
LWILRDHLDLTGTKFGCGMALCGACTVFVEGQPTRSCQVPLSSIKTGTEITTIEGLKTREGRAIQAAWEKLDVPQCGYCQSGQVMAAAALLAKTKKADRCGYRRRDGRQPLSLCCLCPHPCRNQGSGAEPWLTGDIDESDAHAPS